MEYLDFDHGQSYRWYSLTRGRPSAVSAGYQNEVTRGPVLVVVAQDASRGPGVACSGLVTFMEGNCGRSQGLLCGPPRGLLSLSDMASSHPQGE